MPKLVRQPSSYRLELIGSHQEEHTLETGFSLGVFAVGLHGGDVFDEEHVGMAMLAIGGKLIVAAVPSIRLDEAPAVAVGFRPQDFVDVLFGDFGPDAMEDFHDALIIGHDALDADAVLFEVILIVAGQANFLGVLAAFAEARGEFGKRFADAALPGQGGEQDDQCRGDNDFHGA